MSESRKLPKLSVCWMGPDTDEAESDVEPAKGLMRRDGMTIARWYMNVLRRTVTPLTGKRVRDIEIAICQMDVGGSFRASCEVRLDGLNDHEEVAGASGVTWQSALDKLHGKLLANAAFAAAVSGEGEPKR